MIEFNLRTFILGAVQGLCEFLPVSSSGHLALLQQFFGFGQDGQAGMLAFDLLLHCATVLAVLLFFWRDIVALFVQWLWGCVSSAGRGSEGWRYGWAILLACVLTALVGLPLKGVVERMMGSPLAVGCGLLVTAGLLALVPLIPERGLSLTWKAALIVGIAQGLAVLPGVSRSGSTIAAGLLMGLAVGDAFRFSFLISVPAILGASLLEGLKLYKGGTAPLPEGWLLAAAAAFVLGWLALKLMRRLVLSGRWAYFGLYCLLLGCAAILSTLDIF